MNPEPQAKYHVFRDGKMIGWFTADQLLSGVKQGSLFATDLYGREGWPERRRLADFVPPKEKAVTNKERMELRHIGIAMVMLLGIAAVGLGIFAVSRANRGGLPIEATVSVPATPNQSKVANTSVPPPTPEQLAPPIKTNGIEFEQQSEELHQKARRLFKGDGIPKDVIEAARIWQQLAQQGHAEAQYNLGKCYFNGKGHSKDVAKAVEWWTKSAEQRNADAQLALGVLCLFGEMMPKDVAKADEWFRKAGAKGDPEVQFNLGRGYAIGEGVFQDSAKALGWYRKAADQGHGDAQFMLGICYYNGEGISKDAAKAVEWWAKAADQGLTSAQYNLGVLYANGENVSKDPAKALEWYRRAADQGHVESQLMLGMGYYNGEGISKDAGKAAGWWTKAANQGHPDAQYNLGVVYAKGEGVPKDAAKAATWYSQAAEKGHAAAQLNLGNCYDAGEGVPKDAVKAVEWWTKAANQGLPSAQYNLGLVYAAGDGVPKSANKAVEWWTKSAEQGTAAAQFNLGNAYSKGNGTHRDEAEATKWYRKAAEQGFIKAQYLLGLSYTLGKGVPKDFVLAHYWLNLAAAAGHIEARESMTPLETLMTISQISEAQRMAREVKPRKAIAETERVTPKMIGDSRPSGQGTGFFITTDGYLVTNHHVVEETSQVRINTGSGIKVARVVRKDAANDLALLKVEGTFPALSIASSRAMTLGSTVATVGFPNIELMGFSPKLAKGDIASLAGIQDDPRYFQISVPVQPGNSGGALVDEAGNVVGVVSAKLSARVALATTGSLPENVNYAVKSSLLLSFLESVPELTGKLLEPHHGERKFAEVVQAVQQASVLVLVY